jgi:hypothetical protein
MPVTVREKFDSRSGDDEQIDLLFVIEGTNDDAVARAALAAEAPTTFNGLVRQKPSIEPLGENLWDGRVRYVKDSYEQPQTGDSAFSFDTTGGTQHITQSKANIAKYAPSGQTAPDFGGAIGVTHDNVEGVDITVPVFAFNKTRYIDPSDMTQSYITALYALTGKVNSTVLNIDVDGVTLTFQPGECLFLGATGGKRKQDDWEINFRFAGSPNATNLTIGTITGINKKGWEYLWVRYADSEDANVIVKKPVAVYVEKVYELADLTVLGA